jgi:hypothetical protein
LRFCLRICREELRSTVKKSAQDSRCTDRDSKASCCKSELAVWVSLLSLLCVNALADKSRFLSLYGSTALVNLGRFFSFLIYTQSVGLLGRVINPSQGRCLHTKQYKHRINGYRYPCPERNSNPRSQCLSGRRRFMP